MVSDMSQCCAFYGNGIFSRTFIKHSPLKRIKNHREM